MQNKKDNVRKCANEAVAELFHLQLNASDIKPFVDKGELIHNFFSTLEGYVGMDMLFLSEVKLLVLIRWSSYKLFDSNLPAILNACAVKDWLVNMVSVSHQPAILKSYSI